MANRCVRNTKNPDQQMTTAKAWMLAEAKLGTLGSVGSYDTPKEGVHADYRGATIGASPAYSYTVHVAEVAVDVDTGDVTVKNIWAAHDCGKAISPISVQGQIEVLKRLVPANKDNKNLHNSSSLQELTLMEEGNRKYGLGSIHLEGWDVATFTMNMTQLTRNLTYGEHYRLAIYIDCKPCPPRYVCAPPTDAAGGGTGNEMRLSVEIRTRRSLRASLREMLLVPPQVATLFL